jgi:hypothetical protein
MDGKLRRDIWRKICSFHQFWVTLFTLNVIFLVAALAVFALGYVGPDVYVLLMVDIILLVVIILSLVVVIRKCAKGHV